MFFVVQYDVHEMGETLVPSFKIKPAYDRLKPRRRTVIAYGGVLGDGAYVAVAPAAEYRKLVLVQLRLYPVKAFRLRRRADALCGQHVQPVRVEIGGQNELRAHVKIEDRVADVCEHERPKLSRVLFAYFRAGEGGPYAVHRRGKLILIHFIHNYIIHERRAKASFF